MSMLKRQLEEENKNIIVKKHKDNSFFIHCLFEEFAKNVGDNIHEVDGFNTTDEIKMCVDNTIGKQDKLVDLILVSMGKQVPTPDNFQDHFVDVFSECFQSADHDIRLDSVGATPPLEDIGVVEIREWLKHSGEDALSTIRQVIMDHLSDLKAELEHEFEDDCSDTCTSGSASATDSKDDDSYESDFIDDGSEPEKEDDIDIEESESEFDDGVEETSSDEEEIELDDDSDDSE